MEKPQGGGRLCYSALYFLGAPSPTHAKDSSWKLSWVGGDREMDGRMGRCYLIWVSQSRWDLGAGSFSTGDLRNKQGHFLLLIAEQLPVVWEKASGKASAASATDATQPEGAAIGNTRL